MIEKMGQQSGVLIPSVSRSGAASAAAAADQTVAALPYQVSISIGGTYAQVQDFIKKTENSARVMDFVTLNIAGSTKSGPVTASATFTVYYQLPANINPTEKGLE